MTFWETFAVATAPAILTLIITLFAESRRRRRDAAERAADRDAEVARRAEERQDALDETWRTERRDVYARLASMAEQACTMADEVRLAVGPPRGYRSNPASMAKADQAYSELQDLVVEELPRVMAEVALLASDPVHEQATALAYELRELDRAASILVFVLDADIFESPKAAEHQVTTKSEQVTRATAEVEEQRVAFLIEARVNIGTA